MVSTEASWWNVLNPRRRCESETRFPSLKGFVKQHNRELCSMKFTIQMHIFGKMFLPIEHYLIHTFFESFIRLRQITSGANTTYFMSFNNRIFTLTENVDGNRFLHCFNTSEMTSGLFSRAQPMPICLAHLCGQPQFKSTPSQYL